ncbi:uncharacterized protein N7477_010079 [Penicillium maclennaniae]|uniref:uncharacterized protein n=1 Tax=Penicillium maclennaniae TaxID=1343394 RepID=UPI00254239E7|nr:uncharacterized protein N7477_010079 [Penicillium maclennaniae]KAJ5662463.1 hypothetical protein N7477_010079 [Penicillium maclennaniae]
MSQGKFFARYHFIFNPDNQRQTVPLPSLCRMILCTFISHSIPPEKVREHGCFTIFPVRRHDGFETVNAAAKVARKEWEDIMGEEIPSTFSGSESPLTGPWDSLVLPECAPELLFLVGWMTQTFFLVDDKKKEPTTPLERLFLPRLRQMLDYNHEGASLLFEGWRDWLQKADTRDEDTV